MPLAVVDDRALSLNAAKLEQSKRGYAYPQRAQGGKKEP